MTCHHSHLPFRFGRQYLWANRVVGKDKDRCRCVHKSNVYEHCHQRADGEDMICGPCRQICQSEEGLGMGFVIQVDDRPLLEVFTKAPAGCAICLRNDKEEHAG